MASEPVSLALMPHEVWAGFACCFTVVDMGRAVGACRLALEELANQDLWLQLFLSSCWPPSDALLVLTEGGEARSFESIDWRARLRARAAAAPAIVVDVGIGYTKYSVVHGITGRAEGDTVPNLVQLCSSPTHPPHCDRNEQLLYIHQQLDQVLPLAAVTPGHPLRQAALARGGAEPAAGRLAVLRGFEEWPEADGQVVRLRGAAEDQEPGEPRWEVERPPDPGDSARSSQRLRRRVVPARNLQILNRANDLPLLVGEPFIQTAQRCSQEVEIGDGTIARWVGNQLTGRAGPTRIVPQAQMALWAHGVDHGIVVNIGQQQTIAQPVINGRAVAGATTLDIGSASLTMFMTNLLADKYDFLGSRVMTWCRDMKEQHCYVAPPSPYGVRSVRDRLASGDDLKVQPIEVWSPPPCSGDVELGEERVLVPEALFGLRGGGGLPQLVLECAARTLRSKLCEEEDVRTLLQQIVLVGGAADFPNIRTRVQHEVRALLREGAAPDLLAALRSPEEVFVLNPPLGKKAPLASPRFVPLIGGCVRAASSLSFDDWHSGEGVALQIQPRGVLCRGSDEHNLPALIRRRLFSQLRSGPAVFRTGGGAGEDDAWQLFGSDVSDSDEDLEEDDDPVRPEDVEMEDCGESQEDEEEDADEMDGGASADARGAHR